MKSYQVIGIGNAIVDVFSTADDSFLDLMGIEKGIMQAGRARAGRDALCRDEGPPPGAGRVGRQYHRRDRRLGPDHRLHRPRA